jgi:hypothetical protein
MPLSEPQKNIADSPARFRVAVSGRRFGKTHIAIRELAKHARFHNQICWAVFPSYRMARTVVWDKLKKQLSDLNWIAKVNESDLSIKLVNGSQIALRGADNFDSLRGIGLNFLCMDEVADIDEKAWTEVLRPTLSDKQGKALFLGTPKGIGNWLFDLYQRGQDPEEHQWESWQYSTIEGGVVPQEEIEAARNDLDEATFRQEYMASFETATNRVYYAFNRQQNIKAYDGTIDRNEILYTGWDFNIDPMSIVVAVKRGDQLYVIDEVCLYSSNTQEACDEIRSRYPTQRIWAYPDPASRQRKTSAGGLTDLSILSNNGFTVKAPNSHTQVRDRINAVNSRLKSASGQVNLYVDAGCKHLIESLEKQSYKAGSTIPDKDSGFDHMNDALGYMIDYMFPVRRDTSHIAQPKTWGHKLSAH